MRKIMAFVLGYSSMFVLSFSFLPKSYSLIVNWLGPIFGTSLHLLLSIIYFLVGNPLKLIAVLGLWITIGIICGVIVRRRLGSVVTVLIVFITALLVAAVSALRLYDIATSLGITENPQVMLGILPPFPPGTTIGNILGGPIIDELFIKLQEVLVSMTSPMTILLQVASSLILNLILNLVILIFSSLIGCEIGVRFVEKHIFPHLPFQRRIFTPRDGTISENEETSEKTASKGKTKQYLSLFMIVFILSSPTILTIIRVSGIDEDTIFSSEGMLSYVTPDGSAYLASIFSGSNLSIEGIDFSDPEFSDTALVLILSHEFGTANFSSLVRSFIPGEDQITGIVQNFSGYYELLPKTLLLIAYIGVDSTVGKERADLIASKLSYESEFNFSFLISFSQELEDGSSEENFMILIYQSSASLSEVGDKILNSLPSEGLGSVVKNAYESGTLIPGETKVSANGTILAAGTLSVSIIMDQLGSMGNGLQELISVILPSDTGSTSFVGFLSYWINKYHSSSFDQSFNINALLNYPEDIQFSSEALLSIIAMIVPNATILENQIISQKHLISIITSANLTQPEFAGFIDAIQTLDSTAGLTVIQTSKGVTLDNELLTMSFTQVFPLNLIVEKSVSKSKVNPGQVVEVSIKIVNNDESLAESIKLDDSSILNYYILGSIEVEESSLINTWDIIGGNSEVTYSYSLKPKKEGIYTIPSSNIEYNYMNQAFNRQSNIEYVKVRSPFALKVLIAEIPSGWRVLEKTINTIPFLDGKGSLILALITLTIIGPIAVLELRNIRKWIKTKYHIVSSH